MAQVTVRINGFAYTLACQDGEEQHLLNMAAEVDRLTTAYREAGFGHGHRVGLLLLNRPEFLCHFLALNALGVSAVPINAEFFSPRPFGGAMSCLLPLPLSVALFTPDRRLRLAAALATVLTQQGLSGWAWRVGTAPRLGDMLRLIIWFAWKWCTPEVKPE